MKKMKNIFVLLLFLLNINLYSQTCGFGCLGLSGIYGGYSAQQYDATGLNNYLNYNFSPFYSENMEDNSSFNFKEARGIKVGMNIVRARYTHTFFTLKGFYQFLEETGSLSFSVGNFENNYDALLKMDNWGLGIDFGIPIFSFLDWKIIDGEVKFFNPKLELSITTNNPDDIESDIEGSYTPIDIKVGYSIGTGVIINLIQDYVSIEATAIYTFMDIDFLSNDSNGLKIPNTANENFIAKGGYGAFVQLNIGIPL